MTYENETSDNGYTGTLLNSQDCISNMTGELDMIVTRYSRDEAYQ